MIPKILLFITMLSIPFAGIMQSKERPEAEDRKKERMEKLHKAWLQQMEDQLQRQKSLNKSKMKLRLDFLERGIGLEEEQMEKLKLASQGAVERASQAWLDHHEKMWKAEQENRYSREQLDENQVNPIHREVWTNALDTTLTPKQKRKYQMEMGIRASYFGTTMLKLRLSVFDQQALLTRRQRDLLTQKLEIALSIPLEDVSPETVLQAVQKAYLRITPQEQQEILTTEQQALWLQFMKNPDRYSRSLEMLENDMLEDVVRGGGIFDF